MNETFFYDPTYYHVSNTQAAFITLDGSNLRIQTPQKGIAKRSTYKEGNIPISNVVHQRLFDITFAKIYLKPDGLVKKRVWSKKYPVVVEIPKLVQEAKTKSQIDSTSKDKDSGEPQEKVDVNKSDIEILYLFGRTDRQKEEWFYRIQRSINVALARHISKEATPDGKQSEERKPLLSIDDGWGVIDDNHYKEETFLSSSLCLGESINSDPLRAYKDYYLHISRLMPDDFPLNNNRRLSK
uniref:PH domain-containing protein n=1 Tax=Ciona savignyi TaxID=51511 RepID=H2ZAC3_CIOSA